MKILKIFIILFLFTNFSELRSKEINNVLKNKIIIKKFVGPINQEIVYEIKLIIK